MLPFRFCPYQPIIVLLELNPHLMTAIKPATLSLSCRYDMPGADVIHWGWGFMGPSLSAGDVPGRGFFQGRLLSVPQHVWGTDTTVQCQGVWGEEFTALTSIYPHTRTDWEPRRPAWPGVFRGLHQHFRGKGPSGRDWGSTAEQAAEDEFIREGGPAEEGASAQLAALWKGMQHRRPAPEAAAPQLLAGTRGGESTATQVPQGGLRTHDSVYWRPVPAQPTTHTVSRSGPHAQPSALSWREAGGQPATEAAEDERRPLKPRQSLTTTTTTTDSHWPPTTDRQEETCMETDSEMYFTLSGIKRKKQTVKWQFIDLFFLETQPLLELLWFCVS